MGFTLVVYFDHDLSIYDWLPFPLLILVANYSLLSAGNHVVCLGWWEWQQSHRYLWRCWDFFMRTCWALAPHSRAPQWQMKVSFKITYKKMKASLLEFPRKHEFRVPICRYLWLTTTQWCVGCREAFQEPMVRSRSPSRPETACPFGSI